MSGEQSDFWNGAGGGAWVAMQPVLDRMFVGFERIGPIGQALREADESARAEVLEVARAGHEPFVGDEVRFTARYRSVGAENR